MGERISRFGQYAGFSDLVANGYVRSSQYLEMDDGCRIAIDVLRPTLDGEVLAGRLPTIVQATGYRRAYFFGENDLKLVGDKPGWKQVKVGDLITGYEKSSLAKRLVDHGYNLVCIDLRGTGASFGKTHSQMWRNSADVAQIVDWIPTQEWATDKVGMIGISWEGTIQLTTCAYGPKHLAAIAPMATSTGFSAFCDNGLMLHGFYNIDWAGMRADQEAQAPALPVDGNEGPKWFEEAVAERAVAAAPEMAEPDPISFMRLTQDAMLTGAGGNAPPPPLPEEGSLRDSLDEVARINASGTAIMLVSGWWDITFSGHIVDFFRALQTPKRLLMGPWHHLGASCSEIEQHRWFDYWLKGVENGVADDQSFHFASVDAFGEEHWFAAPAYPLPEVRKRQWFLTDLNELHARRAERPTEIDYAVDYEVTLGKYSRSRFFFRDRRRIIPPELNERAGKCLSFTSSSFNAGAQINGRAELFAYLSTTGTSGALVATLEEVLEDGRATYITEGSCNFFHRAISDAPRPHDGRAFHSQKQRDLLDVEPGVTMEVGIEFYPVAWRLSPNSRIRLTLAGADADNLLVVPIEPAPNLNLKIGGEPASRLYLPVVDPTQPQSAETMDWASLKGDHSEAFDYLEP